VLISVCDNLNVMSSSAGGGAFIFWIVINDPPMEKNIRWMNKKIKQGEVCVTSLLQVSQVLTVVVVEFLFLFIFFHLHSKTFSRFIYFLFLIWFLFLNTSIILYLNFNIFS